MPYFQGFERYDKGFVHLPWQHLPFAHGGICVEGYGGEAGTDGPVLY